MRRAGRTLDAATEDDAVVDALLSVSRVFMALTAHTLSALNVDVTVPQYRMMVVLASRGPQRTVDLAAEMGVTPPTVTRMCDRLIRKGLVKRRHRPGDRRVSWLGLTEDGKELVGTTMLQRRTEIAHLVDRVSLKDPGVLAVALTALVEAAGETPDPQWWEHWAASARADDPTAS